MPKDSRPCDYCCIRPAIDEIRGTKRLRHLCSSCRALFASAKAIEAVRDNDYHCFFFELTSYGVVFQKMLEERKKKQEGES